MKNFKIGDLVTLSAQGESLSQNSHAFGGWGIVVDIKTPCHDFPIKCVWSGGAEQPRPALSISFKRYELKFFKKFS